MDGTVLEVAWIDVRVRDAGAQRGLNDAVAQAQGANRRQAQSVSQLDARIKGLTQSVQSSRSAYIAGFKSEQAYREETGRLKNEISELTQKQRLNVRQTLALNRAGATAERGLATLRGEASRLGIAQQTIIARGQGAVRVLSSFGPAGNIAARALRPLSNIMGAVVPAIFLTSAALAIRKLKDLGDQAAAVADPIQKGAAATGLSIEAYQELSFALDQNGLSQEQFRKGLSNFNARVGESIQGNKEYKKTFDQLGISFEDNQGKLKTTEQLFTETFDAISKLPNEFEKTQAASDLFGGRVAQNLLPALEGGVEGLNELRQQAREAGLVISGDAVLSLVQYKDELAVLERQLQTTKIEITAGFLPVLRQGIIPLLQNGLVPLLQQGANKLETLVTRFYDAGEEGKAFRGDIASITAGTLALGNTLLQLGTIAVGLIQILSAPFAALGSAIGTASVELGVISQGIKQFFSGDFAGARASFSLAGQLEKDAFTGAIDSFTAQAQAGLENVLKGASGLVFDQAAFKRDFLQTLDSIAEQGQGLGPTLSEITSTGVEEGVTSGLNSPGVQTGEDELAARLKEKLSRAFLAAYKIASPEGVLGGDRKFFSAGASAATFASPEGISGSDAKFAQQADAIKARIRESVFAYARTVVALSRLSSPEGVSGSDAKLTQAAKAIDDEILRYANARLAEIRIGSSSGVSGSDAKFTQAASNIEAEIRGQIASFINLQVARLRISSAQGISGSDAKFSAAADAIDSEIIRYANLRLATFRIGSSGGVLGSDAKFTQAAKDIEQEIFNLVKSKRDEVAKAMQNVAGSDIKFNQAALDIDARIKERIERNLSIYFAGQVGAARLATDEGISGSDRKFGFAAGTGDIGSDFYKKQLEAADESAEKQLAAAEAFNSTVVQAAVSFASAVVQGIQTGDAGSVVSGLGSLGGSIAGAAIGGPAGIAVAGGIQILSSLFGGLLSNRDNELDRQRQLERQRSSVSTINFNFEVVQNIDLPESDLSSQANLQVVSRYAYEVFEQFYSRTIGPRLAAIEAKL